MTYRQVCAAVVVAALVLAGCGPAKVDSTPAYDTTTTSSAENEVAQLIAATQRSMQDKFNTDPDYKPYGLDVRKVDLVHQSGNEYTGIATIHAANGMEKDVVVQVTSDGTKLVWQTQPGALLFAG